MLHGCFVHGVGCFEKTCMLHPWQPAATCVFPDQWTCNMLVTGYMHDIRDAMCVYMISGHATCIPCATYMLYVTCMLHACSMSSS